MKTERTFKLHRFAVVASLAYCAISSTSFGDILRMPLLQPSDLVSPAGVQLAAQLPQTGMTLYDKTPAGSVWQTPMASRQLDGDSVQIWYLRVDYGVSSYQDQLTLCLGEINNGQWSLTQAGSGSAPWGGVNNVVMKRSPWPSTWGGFAPHQIVESANGLQMLYWDQPGPPPSSAGGLRATSLDGKTWNKIPNTVFTDFNDNFTLRREGNVDNLYQQVLQPWPDKPYPDNLSAYRRVISLRTSTNQFSTWTPANSANPTLAPDMFDPVETEFYGLKTFEYGSGYAGILWKYYADPNRPNEHSRIFKYELVVSDDGANWQRPYRDVDLGFYSYGDPFELDGKMWLATQGFPGTVVEGDTFLKGWSLDRMVAATGNGSFQTQTFSRPDGKLAINADVTTGSLAVWALDSSGAPVPGLSAFQVVNANGTIDLPWNNNLLPAEMSLLIGLNGGAKVFAVTSLEPAGALGDFNSDGVVDAADYSTWRDNLGSAGALPNDNGLGTPIGQQHYDLWKANFGQTGSGTGAIGTSTGGVPEPSTSALLIVSVLVGLTNMSSRRVR